MNLKDLDYVPSKLPNVSVHYGDKEIDAICIESNSSAWVHEGNIQYFEQVIPIIQPTELENITDDKVYLGLKCKLLDSKIGGVMKVSVGQKIILDI